MGRRAEMGRRASILVLSIGVSLALVAGATLASSSRRRSITKPGPRACVGRNELVRISDETDELELMAAELQSRVQDGRMKLERARRSSSVQRARIERLTEKLERLTH